MHTLLIIFTWKFLRIISKQDRKRLNSHFFSLNIDVIIESARDRNWLHKRFFQLTRNSLNSDGPGMHVSASGWLLHFRSIALCCNTKVLSSSFLGGKLTPLVQHLVMRLSKYLWEWSNLVIICLIFLMSCYFWHTWHIYIEHSF